jgi:hypothetical protein
VFLDMLLKSFYDVDRGKTFYASISHAAIAEQKQTLCKGLWFIPSLFKQRAEVVVEIVVAL